MAGATPDFLPSFFNIFLFLFILKIKLIVKTTPFLEKRRRFGQAENGVIFE
jgi:hypothetical protein